MKKLYLILSFTLGVAFGAGAEPTSAHWAITGHIQIGGNGVWDYLTVQPDASRLYVSHTFQVVVIDLKTNTVVGSLKAAGVHGIALAPELNRGFISNGGNGTVRLFDLKSLKPLQEVKVGENPDAICYEPVTKRVFAFNGRSGTASVIDAATGKNVGEIPLPGKPEFAQADGQGSVFVNIEDKDLVLKIEASKLEIVARWPLPPRSEPSALALDKAGHRLFIGCRDERLRIMSSDSGKILAALPIGKGVDACVYDPEGKRVFASCGDGTMWVIHQRSPDSYELGETVPTAPGSRTMAFNPDTGTAYVPAAKFGPPPKSTEGSPKQRPSIIPNTFEVLILTRS